MFHPFVSRWLNWSHQFSMVFHKHAPHTHTNPSISNSSNWIHRLLDDSIQCMANRRSKTRPFAPKYVVQIYLRLRVYLSNSYKKHIETAWPIHLKCVLNSFVRPYKPNLDFVQNTRFMPNADERCVFIFVEGLSFSKRKRGLWPN